MRFVARALLLTMILLVAGCSHSRDSNPIVADVTSIIAPDSVRTGETFAVIYHAVLGGHLSYVLDHVDTLVDETSFAVRIWARDESHGAYSPDMFREEDLAFATRSSSPGEFRVLAYLPDGKETLKTITVLP